MGQSRMSFDQADTLQYFLETQPGVTKATVYEQTQDAVIEYNGELKDLIEALKRFHYEDVQLPDSVRSSSGRALNVEYKEKLIGHVAKRLFTKYMLPLPIRNVYTIWKAFHYVKEGVVCLSRGKLEVPVLDATAITVSILRRDCPTAGSVMFLLGLGEILEEWTHKKVCRRSGTQHVVKCRQSVDKDPGSGNPCGFCIRCARRSYHHPCRQRHSV